MPRTSFAMSRYVFFLDALDRRILHEGLESAHVEGELVTLRNEKIDLGDLLLEGNQDRAAPGDRKSTRLNSSHSQISYAVFCLKKKTHSIHLRSTLAWKRHAGPVRLAITALPHRYIRCVPAVELTSPVSLHRAPTTAPLHARRP